MSALGDPADKVLDAAADGAFGGRHSTTENRRAGYGDVEFEGQTYTKLEWLLRAARRGDCLPWGDAAKVCAYYEAEIKQLRTQNAVLMRAVVDAAEEFKTQGSGTVNGWIEEMIRDAERALGLT